MPLTAEKNRRMITMNHEYQPKEKAIYQAVLALFEEGADINNITVAEITGRAGIGKGTAYEYFSGKEEMIAKAFFYNGEMFCRQLYDGVCGERTLSDKVNYVLLAMERQMTKTNCVFRLMHMMADNSPVSGWIRRLLQEKKELGVVPAEDVIRKVLEDELGGRAVPSEEKMKYLMLSIYSKIFCYGMLLNDDKYQQEEQRAAVRGLVNRGICREVEEIFASF